MPALQAWFLVAINVHQRSLVYLRPIDSLWRQSSSAINYRLVPPNQRAKSMYQVFFVRCPERVRQCGYMEVVV